MPRCPGNGAGVRNLLPACDSDRVFDTHLRGNFEAQRRVELFDDSDRPFADALDGEDMAQPRMARDLLDRRSRCAAFTALDFLARVKVFQWLSPTGCQLGSIKNHCASVVSLSGRKPPRL